MLVLRKANQDDAEDLFKWRFDAESIKNSFQKKPVTYENHIEWFDAALNDVSKKIYIGLDVEKKLGVVRFDIEDKIALVSLIINPEMRGQGRGQLLLSQACDVFQNEHSDIELVAEIKPTNTKSIVIFEQCGFNLSKKSSSKLKFIRNANGVV